MSLNHLFLQGPKQIGKSTLLSKVIEPYGCYFGGFYVQRLLKKDVCVAFALRDIEDASNYSLSKAYSHDDTDIFIEKINGEFKIKLDVFENKGVSVIKKSEGK